MLDDHRWGFMLLSVIGILALCVYLWKFTPPSKLANVAIAFVIGGGVGNMIDRVRLGFVVDFIDFYAFPSVWKWVFNVADSFVCIGAGLLMLYLVLDIIKEGKEKKANEVGNQNENA
jgi:signal peptidase II